MIRRHPSRSRLAAWIAGADDDAVADHLATCTRCATICEDLEAPPAEGALSQALLAVLQPPADLAPRLESSVSERLDSRVIGDYVFDLFAAGLDTGRLLLLDPPAAGDEHVEMDDSPGHTDGSGTDTGDGP